MFSTTASSHAMRDANSFTPAILSWWKLTTANKITDYKIGVFQGETEKEKDFGSSLFKEVLNPGWISGSYYHFQSPDQFTNGRQLRFKNWYVFSHTSSLFAYVFKLFSVTNFIWKQNIKNDFFMVTLAHFPWGCCMLMYIVKIPKTFFILPIVT